MTTRTAPAPVFPCPFCHSNRVMLIGGGRALQHYRCSDCAEVWTAMSAPRPGPKHRTGFAPAAVKLSKVTHH